MADTVASQTIVDGPKYAVLKFTNVSDGTGESAVTKVDVSALATSTDGTTCTSVVIERLWWQCIGMKVQILFDATSDVFVSNLVKTKVVITTTPCLGVFQTMRVRVKQATLSLLP